MLQKIKIFVPILKWLPEYQKKDLKGDLIAGLTVGVMLIPQGMAYAMLAGLPPIYGLYASIVPLILYAIFGTSRQLAVGPVAMVSLLVASGVASLAGANMEAFMMLSFLLSFLVGAILILMGIFRLGFLVNFLSHPVISGFTSAAALIIGLSQLKHLFGIDIPRSQNVLEIITESLHRFDEINIQTLIIGLLSILIMVMVKKTKLPIPGPLITVFFGIIIVWFTGWHEQGVAIVGSVPEGLPRFSIPNFSWQSIKSLFPIALTIAFVGFMESIAVAKAIQRKRKNYKLNPNQELIALGAANLGGSLFQCFPVSGGFSRTAVNDEAGANTGLAAFVSASLISITLLFLTPLFYYLPNAILAAVIMVAVFGLIDSKEAVKLWKFDKGDLLMLLSTFLGTLIIGIEGGILIGIVLSLALIIFRTSDPHIAELGRISETSIYRNVTRFEDLEIRSDVLIFRFDSRLYFANTNAFKEFLDQKELEKGQELKGIILDAESINGLDSSGVHFLENTIDYYNSKSVKFFIAGVKGPIRDVIHKTGLVEKIGAANLFINVQDAVNYFDDPSLKRENDKFILQSNEIIKL